MKWPSLSKLLATTALFRRSPEYSAYDGIDSNNMCYGSSKGCWGKYSIATDTTTTWPNTGKTVEYNFTITNTTCAPDGVQKPCLLINNQYPGPTVLANWGDMVKVNVFNQLQDNGTGIHWHGIRQLGTNDQDGVNGLTECPIAPGDSKSYIWQATTFGTSWYHSHFSAQYGDGVVGPIQINGPTSADWDIDLGPITITEIYRTGGGGSSAVDNIIAHQGTSADMPANTVFNGKNVNANGGGERLTLTAQPGQKHLMRFVNIAEDNFYKVGVDGHMLQVVAIDFTPVKPYTAQYVSLGIGQRADVILTANQTVANYFIRAIPGSCVTNMNDGKGTQTAVLSYNGAPAGLPTTKAADVNPACVDEPAASTIPFVPKSVDVSKFNPLSVPISAPFKVQVADEGNVFRWTLGNTTEVINWENPILKRLVENNNTIDPRENVIPINDKNVFAFWYIQNQFNAAHPIHMHGNDFSILSQGPGEWDKDVSKLNTNNPIRRDTTMVEGNGYVVFAYFTDNPGVWLVHCHIAWHVSEGLSAALYVRKDDIKLDRQSSQSILDVCKDWDAYVPKDPYQQFGSGL